MAGPDVSGPIHADRERHPVGSATAKLTRTIVSAAVVKGEREVGIDHHGEIYRLKITRQGKLILTK